MAVEIKSGAGTDLATVDAVSKAVRVTLYTSDGHEGSHSAPEAIATNNVTQVNGDLISATDVDGFAFVSLQITGTWVGTVTFQSSADQGTWFDVASQNVGVLLNPYVTSVSVPAGVKIPVMFKYLRVRVTAFTSGVVEGVAYGNHRDSNTGQISATGELAISAGQTLATVTNLEQLGGQAVSMGAGVTNVGTQRVVLASDSPVSLAASANFIGKVSISPGASLTPLFILGLAGAVNVNSGSVSAAPATLRAITFTSYTATARHFKLYDTASVPAAGAGTPVIVCSMPASGTLVYPLPVEGFPFSLGIGYTMTLGAANNDVTPTATAPDFSVSLIYS
jgi:hypothetical protein